MYVARVLEVGFVLEGSSKKLIPFGVSSAQAIFQPTMESILGGLPNVCVYLVDILVTGKSEAAHLDNLQAVLQVTGIWLKREKSPLYELLQKNKQENHNRKHSRTPITYWLAHPFWCITTHKGTASLLRCLPVWGRGSLITLDRRWHRPTNRICIEVPLASRELDKEALAIILGVKYFHQWT